MMDEQRDKIEEWPERFKGEMARLAAMDREAATVQRSITAIHALAETIRAAGAELKARAAAKRAAEPPGERKARIRKNLVDRIRELQEQLYDLDREGG